MAYLLHSADLSATKHQTTWQVSNWHLVGNYGIYSALSPSLYHRLQLFSSFLADQVHEFRYSISKHLTVPASDNGKPIRDLSDRFNEQFRSRLDTRLYTLLYIQCFPFHFSFFVDNWQKWKNIHDVVCNSSSWTKFIYKLFIQFLCWK